MEEKTTTKIIDTIDIDPKLNSQIEAIMKKDNISKEELIKKIDEKEKEFEGLVSKEGAIYMIGKELGIDVSKPKVENLKIKNIVPDMRQINIITKIIFISPLREFNRKGKLGRVQNLTLGDNSGTITMSIWNEDVDKLSELEINDVIEIKNGFSKTGYLDKTELVFTSRSSLKKSDEELIITQTTTTNNNPTNNNNNNNQKKSILTSLVNAKEFDFVKINGCLATIYEKKIIHNLCPTCRKKTDATDSCPTHGKVIPNKFLIISGTIDDGRRRMNVVFFNNAVESLLQKKAEEIKKESENKTTNQYLKELKIFAKDFSIEGTIKKNKMTNTEELHILVVDKLNISTVIKNYTKELEV